MRLYSGAFKGVGAPFNYLSLPFPLPVLWRRIICAAKPPLPWRHRIRRLVHLTENLERSWLNITLTLSSISLVMSFFLYLRLSGIREKHFWILFNFKSKSTFDKFQSFQIKALTFILLTCQHFLYPICFLLVCCSRYQVIYFHLLSGVVLFYIGFPRKSRQVSFFYIDFLYFLVLYYYAWCVVSWFSTNFQSYILFVLLFYSLVLFNFSDICVSSFVNSALRLFCFKIVRFFFSYCFPIFPKLISKVFTVNFLYPIHRNLSRGEELYRRSFLLYSCLNKLMGVK